MVVDVVVSLSAPAVLVAKLMYLVPEETFMTVAELVMRRPQGVVVDVEGRVNARRDVLNGGPVGNPTHFAVVDGLDRGGPRRREDGHEQPQGRQYGQEPNWMLSLSTPLLYPLFAGFRHVLGSYTNVDPENLLVPGSPLGSLSARRVGTPSMPLYLAESIGPLELYTRRIGLSSRFPPCSVRTTGALGLSSWAGCHYIPHLKVRVNGKTRDDSRPGVLEFRPLSRRLPCTGRGSAEGCGGGCVGQSSSYLESWVLCWRTVPSASSVQALRQAQDERSHDPGSALFAEGRQECGVVLCLAESFYDLFRGLGGAHGVGGDDADHAPQKPYLP